MKSIRAPPLWIWIYKETKEEKNEERIQNKIA